MASVSDVPCYSFHCSICLAFTVIKSAIKTVTIPCGHSFCEVCIASKVRCPVCRSPCDPPDRPLDDLCANNNAATMFSGTAAVRRRSSDRRSRPSSVSDGSHGDAVRPLEEEEVPRDVRPPERTATASCNNRKRKDRKRKAGVHGDAVRPLKEEEVPRDVCPPERTATASCNNRKRKDRKRKAGVHGDAVRPLKEEEVPRDVCPPERTATASCNNRKRQKQRPKEKGHGAMLLDKAEYQRYSTKIRSDAVVMIVERQNQVLRLLEFVHQTNGYAAKDKESAVRVFDALAAAARSHRDALVEEIEERRRTAQEQAQRSTHRLEADIAVLQERIDEMEQSLDAKEHHRLLQTLQMLCGVLEVLVFPELKRTPAAPRRLGRVLTAVAGLEETLHCKMEAVPQGASASLAAWQKKRQEKRAREQARERKACARARALKRQETSAGRVRVKS